MSSSQDVPKIRTPVSHKTAPLSSNYLREFFSDPSPLRNLRASSDKRLLNDELTSSDQSERLLGNKYKTLPPIKSDANNTNNNNDNVQTAPANLDELAEVTLRNEVRQQMSSVTDRTLETLLSDLRKRDRDRDGYLSSAQIHGVLQRFQIPLEPQTQQTLLAKFIQPRVNGFVNYEKLVGFLQLCKREAPAKLSADTLPPVHSPQPKQITAGGRNISLVPSPVFSNKDEARLIVDLEKELGDEKFDFGKIQEAFHAADTKTNGLIAQTEVEQVLKDMGITLSHNVLNRWLQAADQEERGIYSIDRLLSYLEHVKPEMGQLLRGAPMKGAMMTFFFAQPTTEQESLEKSATV